ncbi:hypothetical protein Pint_13816 [Pistacia integerrima]|uniref:Uncharacterized protein n=1 Tax=Pistacia integerrima TaxID=434235 RepID=A0ACC0Y6D4_9ROSI|nr:hypothetical protein Pint_13816 [Pistacia integerrima]
MYLLLSAMTYGLFTVLLKKFSGEKGERVDMQMLYGYIGIFLLVAYWWFAWPLTAMGIEPKFSFPKSAKMTQIILINGFVGNFLSDYFWALGVVWTSPLVAGSSRCFSYSPTSPGGRHAQHYSLLYIIGSVFLGFVVANLADWISCNLILQIGFHVICAD